MGTTLTVLTSQKANASTITVKAGQSITSIAKENNVKAEDLAKANQLSVNSVIHPNQKLNLPTAQTTTVKYYKVKQGDTVSEIAKSHSINTEKLLKINNLSWQNSTIYVNQKLKLSESTSKNTNSIISQSVTQTSTQATTNQTDSTASTNIGNTQGEKAVNMALQLTKMNIPYVWGGETTSGMDCSGLVKYIYGKLGYNLPHNTVAQEAYINYKSVSQAQPGDLLFWGGQGSSYHVAIYIGNGKYVAAPTFGQNVSVGSISQFAPSFAGSLK